MRGRRDPSPVLALSKPVRRPLLGKRATPMAIPPIAAALVIENSGDGVFVADMRLPDQPVVQVNAAFEAITGYSAAEAIGKNCRYLQGSDRLQPAIAEMRAAWRKAAPARSRCATIGATGRSFTMRCGSCPCATMPDR